MKQSQILQILYLVIKWIAVVLVTILCIFAISQKQLIPFCCFSIIVILLLPPLSEQLKVMIPILRYKSLKGFILVCLFFGGILIFPTPPKKAAAIPQNESQPQPVVTINADTFKAKKLLNESQDDTLKLIEQQEARIMENATQKKTKFEEHCMSSWDGSCTPLVDYVKKRMNDPDSFDHVETRYGIQGNYATVVMSYRGKNAFGAKVLNYIKAKISLDCEVIEVYEN